MVTWQKNEDREKCCILSVNSIYKSSYYNWLNRTGHLRYYLDHKPSSSTICRLITIACLTRRETARPVEASCCDFRGPAQLDLEVGYWLPILPFKVSIGVPNFPPKRPTRRRVGTLLPRHQNPQTLFLIFDRNIFSLLISFLFAPKIFFLVLKIFFPLIHFLMGTFFYT